RGGRSDGILGSGVEAQRACAGASGSPRALRSRSRGSPSGRAFGSHGMTAEQAENFDEFESTAIYADDQALTVTVDGFEGPLDLLLTLARNQKVDIAKI